MELEQFLQGVRTLTHLATFLTIASYSGSGARWRPAVSVLAACLAGSSLAMATFALTDRSHALRNGPQWLATLGWLSVLLLVISSRGNVARIIPKRMLKRATP